MQLNVAGSREEGTEEKGPEEDAPGRAAAQAGEEGTLTARPQQRAGCPGSRVGNKGAFEVVRGAPGAGFPVAPVTQPPPFAERVWGRPRPLTAPTDFPSGAILLRKWGDSPGPPDSFLG